MWNATWPKVAAAAMVLFVWQVLVWAHWRPRKVFPSPWQAFASLGHELSNGVVPRALGITMQRAAIGYGFALVAGIVVGLVTARIRFVRAAVGSMFTGLQAMPSVAWFPLAILLFNKSERAIVFVVILGAAPAIVNGLLLGIDHVPPLLLRSGRVLGATGFRSYRHVILPAALPSFISGMKQGWAFAWRSLMSAELLVAIGSHRSLGVLLNDARLKPDAAALIAAMIVILAVGMFVDSVIFGVLERRVRRRWGLVEPSA